MNADLHIHTTASDGKLAPAEIITQCCLTGLSYVSITDHDTVDGLRDLSGCAKRWDAVTVIPGIELSTDEQNYEVHILGYCIDIDNRELKEHLMLLKNFRVQRLFRMVEKLRRLNFRIEPEEVLNSASNAASVGRPHIANVLVAKGYFPGIAQAFQLLQPGGPVYEPHYRMSVPAAVDLIHQAGGIPVLAHPGLIGNDAVVKELLGIAKFIGIEAAHPKHSPEQAAKYVFMAEQSKLIATGGSDFHGLPGRFPERLGLFTVPAAWALSLLHHKECLLKGQRE